MLDNKKSLLVNSIISLINKLFDGVFFIVEKAENKTQLIESLKKFKQDLILSYTTGLKK